MNNVAAARNRLAHGRRTNKKTQANAHPPGEKAQEHEMTKLLARAVSVAVDDVVEAHKRRGVPTQLRSCANHTLSVLPEQEPQTITGDEQLRPSTHEPQALTPKHKHNVGRTVFHHGKRFANSATGSVNSCTIRPHAESATYVQRMQWGVKEKNVDPLTPVWYVRASLLKPAE